MVIDGIWVYLTDDGWTRYQYDMVDLYDQYDMVDLVDDCWAG